MMIKRKNKAKLTPLARAAPEPTCWWETPEPTP